MSALGRVRKTAVRGGVGLAPPSAWARLANRSCAATVARRTIPSVVARIHLTPRAAVSRLTRALEDAGCRVAAHGTIVDVIHASPDDALDCEQAKLELLFFVRAWAADHPGVAATLDL
jgi:hypothetical protein